MYTFLFLFLYVLAGLCVVFFFKQKTAYEMRISDWSSDVCSSDLDARIYQFATDKEDYRRRYKIKFDEIIRQAKELGLAASVYTETSDVEGELNGLLTYDRAVSKLSAEDFAEIAKPLFEDK